MSKLAPFIKHGVIVDPIAGPSVWFRMQTRSQQFKSTEEWRADANAEAMTWIAMQGYDGQLLALHRNYGVEDWAVAYAGNTPKPCPEFFAELEETKARITDAPSGKEVYLGVPLNIQRGREEPKWKTWLRGLLSSAFDFGPVDKWIGTEDPRPPAAVLALIDRMAITVQRRVQSGGFDARLADPSELRWLIRATARRTLPVEPEPRRPAWGGESYALLDVHVENGHHHLRVTHATGEEEYTAFLGMSYLPNGRLEEMSDWADIAEQTNVPGIVVQHRLHVMTQEEARRMAERSADKVRDQFDHIREVPNATVPRELEEQMESVGNVQYDVKNRHRVGIRVWPRLQVSAPTLDDLHERIEIVKDAFFQHEIKLQVPTGDQVALFQEFRPGSPFVLRETYHQEMPVETYAASGVLVSSGVGDDVGTYIGKQSEDGTPVHIDPQLASLRNMATLIGLFGTLGSGKSVLGMKLLWKERLRGTSIVMTTPAGVPEGFLELCRRAGRVRVVAFDDESGKGFSLDPWRLLEPQAAARLASTVFLTLLGPGQSPDVRNTIIAACGQETKLHQQNGSMRGALHILKTEYDLKATADALDTMSRWPIAETLFRESDERLNLYNALTVLRFNGLNLPRADKSPTNWTDTQRSAVAAQQGMIAVSRLITNVGDDNHPKISYYDDVHQMLANPDTRDSVIDSTLTGRKKSEIPMFASQMFSTCLSDSVSDENSLVSNMALCFVFRLPDAKEARIAAERGLRIAPTEQNIHTIQHLGPVVRPGEHPPYSECILRDLDNRPSMVQIDLERREIVEMLSTTPKRLQVVA